MENLADGSRSIEAVPTSLRREPAVWMVIAVLVAAGAAATLSLHRAFGLPAHPLLVHLPIVLIPITSAFCVASVLRPTWRRRFGLAITGLAALTMLSTVLAANAGEALREDRRGERGSEARKLARHGDFGDTLKVLVVLLALSFALLVLVDRLRSNPAGQSVLHRFARIRPAVAIGCVAVVACSVLATTWDVRTGHSGASLTWHGGPPDASAPPPAR
jgi:uncharacterized membrane protein